jgi:hypothetical protein
VHVQSTVKAYSSAIEAVLLCMLLLNSFYALIAYTNTIITAINAVTATAVTATAVGCAAAG